MGAWNVVIPDQFVADLETIGPLGYDWTDALRGIHWYLGHNPLMVGYSTQDCDVRIYLQDRPLGLPGFKVFYLVEGYTVTLLRAKPFVVD